MHCGPLHFLVVSYTVTGINDRDHGFRKVILGILFAVTYSFATLWFLTQMIAHQLERGYALNLNILVGAA